MSAKSYRLFSQLATRFDPSTNLASFLQSKPEREKLSFQTETLLSPGSLLKGVHPSWLEPLADGLPKETFALFLSSKGEEVKAAPFIRPFLASLMVKKLVPEDLAPREHLPSSPLNDLLKISREELLFVIDWLGLVDLAIEIRQVVDRRVIAKVEQALTEQERRRLQDLIKQPIKWLPQRILLASWDGRRASLFKELHPRGLYRLSRAVAGENKDFIWYLTHKLDVGRARVITRGLESKATEQLVPYFRGQLLDLLKGLQV